MRPSRFRRSPTAQSADRRRDRERDTTIENSNTGSPEIIVAKADKSACAPSAQLNFAGRSAKSASSIGAGRETQKVAMAAGVHSRCICLPRPARFWRSSLVEASEAWTRCSGGWSRSSRRRDDGPDRLQARGQGVLPTWSGDSLDNIIDYTTYVLIRPSRSNSAASWANGCRSCRRRS